MRERLIVVIVDQEVHRESRELPPALQPGGFTQSRKGDVRHQHDRECRQDPPSSLRVEGTNAKTPSPLQLPKELRANQEATEYEKNVDAGPAEARKPAEVRPQPANNE